MFKYCTNIEHILYNYCAHIVQNVVRILYKILCKYCKNIEKILGKNCTNTVLLLHKFSKTLSKYCTYTMQIIYKHCANIEQILQKILNKYCSNTIIIYYLCFAQLLFKYWLNIELILRLKKSSKNHANIAQILWKYCSIIAKI